jgi:hypothetical protein
MKKILFCLAFYLAFGMSFSKAQTVPSSGAGIANCEPGTPTCAASGWSPGKHYVSSQKKMGPNYSWVDGTIPSPPSENVTWENGVAHRVFMSLYSADYEVKFVEAKMTGLVPGKTYALKYYIMSSRVHFPHRKSGYGFSGALTTAGVISGDFQNFTPGVNTNKWIQKQLVFKAVSSVQTLTFRNYTQSKEGGIINLDLKGAEWLTLVGSGNQKLSSEWLTNESIMHGEDLQMNGSSDDMTIFPNPAVGRLHIKTVDWAKVKGVEVVNTATGNIVYKSASNPESSINIESFPKGTYSVIITTADGKVSNHRVAIAK